MNKWKIQFIKRSQKELEKLNKLDQQKIINKLDRLYNPRQDGRPLKGDLSNLWRYRIGDYRIIVDIRDNILVVVVIRIAHRREVYNIN